MLSSFMPQWQLPQVVPTYSQYLRGLSPPPPPPLSSLPTPPSGTYSLPYRNALAPPEGPSLYPVGSTPGEAYNPLVNQPYTYSSPYATPTPLTPPDPPALGLQVGDVVPSVVPSSTPLASEAGSGFFSHLPGWMTQDVAGPISDVGSSINSAASGIPLIGSRLPNLAKPFTGDAGALGMAGRAFAGQQAIGSLMSILPNYKNLNPAQQDAMQAIGREAAIGGAFGGPIGAGVGATLGGSSQLSAATYGGTPVTQLGSAAVHNPIVTALNPLAPAEGWLSGKVSEATGGDPGEGPIGMLRRSPLGGILGLTSNAPSTPAPNPQDVQKGQDDRLRQALSSSQLSPKGQDSLRQEFSNYQSSLMLPTEQGGANKNANDAFNMAYKEYFGRLDDKNRPQMSKADNMRADELSNAASDKAATDQRTNDANALNAQKNEESQRAVAMQALIAKLAPELMGSQASPTLAAFYQSIPMVLGMNQAIDDKAKADNATATSDEKYKEMLAQNQLDTNRMNQDHDLRMAEIAAKGGQ